MSTVTKETFWTQIVEDPTLYGTITTEDNLFNYRSDAVWQVMNETFIINGTNFEVTKWEELLGLTSEETSLNIRKANILNHITENLPITIGILEQLVRGMCGENEYIFKYNKDKNFLHVGYQAENENKIKEVVQRVIPSIAKVEYWYDGIPEGYFRAEFLENTSKEQYINALEIPDDFMGAQVVYQLTSVTDYSVAGIFESSSPRLAMYMPRNNAGGVAVGNWGNQQLATGNFASTTTYLKRLSSLNYKNDREAFIKCLSTGDFVSTKLTWSQSQMNYPFYLFGVFLVSSNSIGSMTFIGRIFEARITRKEDLIRSFVPTLDLNGIPCFYETISKSTVYNVGSGNFIVGFSNAQAVKLKDLPVSTGNITISLPTNYTDYEEVLEALNVASSKGWTLTIRTYIPEEDTSTASTFGMRRIWVRKIQDENGIYVDANGNRYQVEWCVEIYSPENKTPEDLGYEQFRSVESAVEYWELTPYVDPTLEEQFNITNEEQ